MNYSNFTTHTNLVNMINWLPACSNRRPFSCFCFFFTFPKIGQCIIYTGDATSTALVVFNVHNFKQTNSSSPMRFGLAIAKGCHSEICGVPAAVAMATAKQLTTSTVASRIASRPTRSSGLLSRPS